MKKLMAVLALTLISVSLFAAGARETVTVNGKLVVTDGVPTIVDGSNTWILPAGPFYRLAFDNGIKAGDSVKAEGYVVERRGPGPRNQAASGQPANAPAATAPAATASTPAGTASRQPVVGTMFIPTRVWVNGKEIDLSSVRMGRPADSDGMGPCDDGMGRGPGSRHGRGMDGADRF